jgi:hypothetical protein
MPKIRTSEYNALPTTRVFLSQRGTGAGVSASWRVRAQNATTSHARKNMLATPITVALKVSALGPGTTVIAENPSTAAKLSTADTNDMAKTTFMISNIRGEWRRANTATYANGVPSRRPLHCAR